MNKIVLILKSPKTWIRVGLLALVIVLSVFLFFIGKEHQFLFDNNTKEINGKSYSALSMVEAQIDKKPSEELTRRMRLNTFATGQKHTLTVKYTDKSGNEVVKSEKFKVPVSERITLISLPAFVQGEEMWREEFLQAEAPVAEEPEASADDMSMDIEF